MLAQENPTQITNMTKCVTPVSGLVIGGIINLNGSSEPLEVANGHLPTFENLNREEVAIFSNVFYSLDKGFVFYSGGEP